MLKINIPTCGHVSSEEENWERRITGSGTEAEKGREVLALHGGSLRPEDLYLWTCVDL
jgi:hypothetical protein